MFWHGGEAAGAIALSARDLAVQALAELEGKLDAGVEAVRARAAEAKARLDSGMLNLRSQTNGASEPSRNGATEPSWDLESAAAADAATGEQLDELAATSVDMPSFDDDGEFDAGGGEFEGIPQSN
jgi:hypothetical protein